MKVSKRFKLKKTQYELDFVDVDTAADIPLFIDPYFLAQRVDPWSVSASRTVRSFFSHLVALISSGQTDAARSLFVHLGEPNETCLGLSRGTPRGRGIGTSNADDIFESLLNSRAVETGLVEDLEDCRIFVEGVDKDKVSDMTTNIIRKHLIEYTQQQCDLWGIATTPDVPSGFFWSRSDREWQNVHTRMLIVANKKLLLVPKAVTSFKLGYTPQRYHQHFVLNFLQHEHLRLNTALVKHTRRRDGSTRSYVTKTDLKARVAPLSKEFLRRFTEDHPEVFRDFRQQTAATVQAPNDEELAGLELEGVVDHLIAELQATPSGTANATKYHRLAVGILELLFYPHLTCPQVEREIHEGRKRIDITFDNAATKGFFFRLHMTYRIPCQFIFGECKNYSEDPANPELDQLSGRFALNRGKFGLLLCRAISDLNLFMARCTDTYRDDRGLIIPLVDDDLLALLAEVRKKNDAAVEQFLSDRYRSIALR